MILNKKLKPYSDYILIFLLSTLVLFWFRDESIILGGDSGHDFPLYPINNLLNKAYVWTGSNGGVVDLTSSPRLPFYVFFALFDALGLSLPSIEKIFFVFTRSLTGFSMYYLTSLLTESKPEKRLVCIFSATIYMFNPFVFLITGAGWWTLNFLAYAGFPLILAFYIKGLRSCRKLHSSVKYSFYLALSSILVTVSVPSYYNVALSIFLLALYTLLYFIFNHSKILLKPCLMFIVMCLLLVFSFNLFWILPMIAQTNIGMNLLSQPAPFFFTSLLDNLLWIGHWGFFAGYFPYAPIYLTSPLFLASLTLSPILCFTAILAKPRDESIVFFSILTVAMLFLSKGALPPLGKTYTFFLTNFPIFKAFRESFKFAFLVTLGYSYLIGTSLGYLIYRLYINKQYQKFSYVLLIVSTIIISLNSWPVITGACAPNSVKVPQSYDELSKWLNNDKVDFKVLLLPSRETYVKYQWGYAGGSTLVNSMFQKSLIYMNRIGIIPHTDCFVSLVYDSINRSSFSKLLGFLNVKYIVVEGCIDTKAYSMTPIDQILALLNSQEGILKVKTFGNLTVYENTHFISHIYATPKAILVNGGLDEMMKIIQKDGSVLNESVLLLSEQLSPQQFTNLSMGWFGSNSTGSISLTYEKVDPTKYIMHVKASQPFFLVFSESYHKDWIANINGEQVSDDQHFMANGYANAWYINKTGSYEIVLEFWPQRLFYIGAIISLATFFFCVLYLCKDRIKHILEDEVKRYPCQMDK
jgi:hypothetical protein